MAEVVLTVEGCAALEAVHVLMVPQRATCPAEARHRRRHRRRGRQRPAGLKSTVTELKGHVLCRRRRRPATRCKSSCLACLSAVKGRTVLAKALVMTKRLWWRLSWILTARNVVMFFFGAIDVLFV